MPDPEHWMRARRNPSSRWRQSGGAMFLILFGVFMFSCRLRLPALVCGSCVWASRRRNRARELPAVIANTQSRPAARVYGEVRLGRSGAAHRGPPRRQSSWTAAGSS